MKHYVKFNSDGEPIGFYNSIIDPVQPDGSIEMSEEDAGMYRTGAYIRDMKTGQMLGKVPQIDVEAIKEKAKSDISNGFEKEVAKAISIKIGSKKYRTRCDRDGSVDLMMAINLSQIEGKDSIDMIDADGNHVEVPIEDAIALLRKRSEILRDNTILKAKLQKEVDESKYLLDIFKIKWEKKSGQKRKS